jgi:hypothetical protein
LGSVAPPAAITEISVNNRNMERLNATTGRTKILVGSFMTSTPFFVIRQ